MIGSIVSPINSAVFGFVEGVTEYLPISSTSHLAFTSRLLGLDDPSRFSPAQLEALKAFEIVTQGGAILAVLFIYMKFIKRMIFGIQGKDNDGRKLFINVCVAFSPVAVLGLLLDKFIKENLQDFQPMIFAMFLGGVVMVRWQKSIHAQNSRDRGFGIFQLNLKQAVIIGFAQCIALWPGTSRSMVTIIAGMIIGLTPVAAAEFAFILGLPTLAAATGYRLLKEGPVLAAHISSEAMLIGVGISTITAFISVRWLLGYLKRNGLSIFGWYRIAMAILLSLYFYRF